MTARYDEQNIFAKILRGEIPCRKLYETPHSLAFHDIAPKAPVHVLVIPKGAYAGWDEFAANASAEEMADFVRAVGEVARMTGAAEGGYRLIANIGAHAHQEAPHLHVHVLGGKRLGAMLPRS